MNLQAEKIIRALNLQKHPEGGYFSELYRSSEETGGFPERFKGKRALYTSIYFLLNENDFSAFHVLKGDEIWHFYEGTALDIHVISKTGKLETITLGRDIENGERMMHLIENGNFFAAEVRDKTSFALVGCTVSPGFEYEDFELCKRDELLQMFPHYNELIDKFSR